MTATGAQLAGWALTQTGKRYSLIQRYGPSSYDCSGLVIAACRHYSVPVPSDVTNTVGLLKWAQREGTTVSRDECRRTVGAVPIKGGLFGNGARGHTGFSLGDGRTMEAHGHFSRPQVGPGTFDGREWGDYILLPGVNYSTKDWFDMATKQDLIDAINETVPGIVKKEVDKQFAEQFSAYTEHGAAEPTRNAITDGITYQLRASKTPPFQNW